MSRRLPDAVERLQAVKPAEAERPL